MSGLWDGTRQRRERSKKPTKRRVITVRHNYKCIDYKVGVVGSEPVMAMPVEIGPLLLGVGNFPTFRSKPGR